jgi:hypothetical protein
VAANSEKTAPSKTSCARRRLPWRHVGILLAVAATVTVIGACSSQTGARSPEVASSVNSSVPPPTGPTSSESSAAEPNSKAPSLSSRSIAPLIIEDVKIQFWQDYSFFTQSNVPVSPQELATMDTLGKPTSPPPGTTVENQEWIVLTVAGNTTAPVTVNDMTILKSCRELPRGGTLFYSPSVGAGIFTVAPVYFNLDQPISIGQYYPVAGSTIPPGGNFFAKEVITLRYQEPQTIAIFVTSSRYCSFSFALSVATANGPVIQTITDNGRPFTITWDGELSSNPHISFPSYAIVYAGGAADEQNNGRFIRVNPATYHGSGDPTSFPVS